VVRRSLAVLIGLSFVALATAVAQNKQPATPPGTAAAKPDVSKTVPVKGPEGADLPIDPKTYVIGPEDTLSISVWREPDFSRSSTVRPDGKITMNLIGDVQAAGLTPERLAAQLTQALSQFINRPEVTVTVNGVNSKKYYITGEVNHAGPFSLVVPIKVFDAINNAGGFAPFANKKNIIIMRGDKRIKFNYADVLKGKNLDQNIYVENGDTIVVK
jgi:polysaccharide biosynthesis/export protein